MFEKASRLKLRFPSSKGMLSTDDLWDLSVNDLNQVFKTLNAQKKSSEEESLLEAKSEKDSILALGINIVKYIFQVRSSEEEARLASNAKAAQKQKLYSILASKQDEELQGKSVEELQEMIDAL
jgi:hypothetical protein